MIVTTCGVLAAVGALASPAFADSPVGGDVLQHSVQPAEQTATPGHWTPARKGEPLPVASVFPTPTAQLPVARTPLVIPAGTTRDFHNAGISGTTSGTSELQNPVVVVEPGATVKNLIIEPPAADGVHCLGTCTLDHVWWLSVGEDAATLQEGSPSSSVMKVIGGGAKNAYDKVFQIDGAGTASVTGFTAENIGTLMRSCGQCVHQHTRHLYIQNDFIQNGKYKIAGVNVNYGDTADISDVVVRGSRMQVCQRTIGHTDRPAEYLPGDISDGTYCRFDPSKIVFQG
ncbi:pectate lyase [Curtobacterium flaccumfaciens]|uniref:pectate lyase n=1 Tax=Curtobacterium flaccumfaciens TaxID=2035 RepID=UPI001BDE9C06|nr:pectate lyase [Curtobacterium flaccumfaciens]MBT1608001.1 pectate lyase [Curtobacterium flaccumfaciens pv. betae]MBT1658527.1 pectate lyase [Curtobacterium flaccumfaciens pv. betae]MCS0472859.1 pectate lyase [Curtobacterium flaccumfaciens pv. betae]MCS0476242.1 pectate lyase [Curtobacterium flaccumfaciens pv. betae]MCS0479709.1 pectate lyase [Curtobacterium flaccumfaciens pv. betae]